MKRSAIALAVRMVCAVTWLVGSLVSVGPLPSAAAAGPAAPVFGPVAGPARAPLFLTGADAGVTLAVPPAPFIGDDVHFTVTFDNLSATDPGYGPYIDLYLPLSGVDGLSGGGPNDGLSLNSATFLGAALTTQTIDCPAGSTITHPLTHLPVTCPAAMPAYTGPAPFHWQLNVLTLPFGSFTNDQPPAVVDVDAAMSNFADLGQPLRIEANGGFSFGADPLDDPGTDPPLVGPITTADTTPTLITIKKIYIGPEDETATGPNYPRQYDIQVEVAPGQTVTNLVVSDLLANNVQYQSLDFTHVHSATVSTVAVSTPSTSVPGGTLAREFATTTGSSTSVDAEVQFTYYIPLSDTSNAAVINPLTGDDVLSLDNAKAIGTWQPLDPRDAGGVDNAVADPPGPEHILTDKSIAIQKTVTNISGTVNKPDDVLSYTLNFQISDFFAFKDVIITDTVSDGQHFDPSFTPTLSVDGNQYTLATTPFDPANFVVDTSHIGNDTNPATDGSTVLDFHVSDQLVTSGKDPRMVGGCVPTAPPTNGTGGPVPDCSVYNNGATTGTIVFHTKILHNFTDTYPSGDRSVDQGDILTDTVLVDGNILGVADATTPTGFREDDNSAASIQIPRGVLSKTIYAVNGVICAPCTNVQISPDFTVTYRLQYALPTSDEEGLTIADFLPLPVFLAGEVTSFDDVTSAAAPGAGHAHFGPADTFRAYSGIVPTMTTDSMANSVTFSYGDFDDPRDQPNTADLLFTVTASHQPFADKLLLTNEAHSFEGSTNAGTQIANNIVQVVLDEPLLKIQKGVIASDDPNANFVPSPTGPVGFSAPGSSCPRFSGVINSDLIVTRPVNSDVTNVDARDLVSFGIVVSNTGHAVHGAFNVVITDSLPISFQVPASGLNLCVTNGAGTPIAYTGTLTTGIYLQDTGPLTGSLSAYTDTSGTNIALVSFDLQAEDGILAATYVNTGILGNYSGVPGGPDYLTTPQTDPADITVEPTLAKNLVTTEIVSPSNALNQVVVGELVTYNVAMNVPEGVMSNAFLTDTLDNGLAFVSFDGFSNSNPVSVTVTHSPPIVTSSSPGHKITFNLGTITNTDVNNSVAETLLFTYTAVALDVTGNQTGTKLNNSIVVSYDGGAVGPASAPNVTVIEPTVNLNQTVSPGTGDAGDVYTYTLVLKNTGGVNAFDVSVNDPLPTIGGPTMMLAPTLGVADSSGLLTTGDFSLTGSDATGWTLNSVNVFDLLAGSGRVITLTLTGALPVYAVPNSTFTNTAETAWTSLPGNPGVRSTFNVSSTERTGADGPGPDASVLNNYATTAPIPFMVAPNTPTKTFVSTSETNTISNSLAIGEIVRFRLKVRLAEGTTPSLTLQDNLPAGLTYLNDGTTKVVFVANDGGITSTAVVSGPGLNVTGNETNVDSIVPTVILPAGDIFGGPFGSGTNPGFNLGTVLNRDSDADQEFVVIEFNALADNVLGNQAGTVLTDTFAVLQNGVQQGGNSNGLAVVIAEPVLTMTKAFASPIPLLPGDPVTFTLVVTNIAAGPNAAAAFDLVLTDTLDNALIGPFTLALDASGNTPCGATPVTPSTSSAGQTVTFKLSCLNPGEHFSATVRATLAPTATAGNLTSNNALVDWTSLPITGTAPGANNPTGSSTPGGSGAANGERNGSGGPGPDNTVLNNYAAPASAELITPAIDKRQPVPADYTIGEPLTFTIVITLPAGLTQGLVVTDNLPAGLGLNGSPQVITTAVASGGVLGQDFGGSVTPAPVVTQTGNSLQVGFGNVNVNADGNPGDNAFILQVPVRVQNVISNQIGTVLTNTAGMLFSSAGVTVTVGAPRPAVVNVVEPELEISKTIPSSPHTFFPGDVVTYTIVVQHDSFSQRTAFDVVITDALPANLINVSASASRSDGLVLSSQIAGGVIRVPDPGDNTFVLPLGLSATVIVTGQVDFAAHPGDLVTNTAFAIWTSLPVTSSVGERHSGDSLLNHGGLNDYQVGDGVYFIVGSATVINLVSFTGTPQPDGSVRLDWQTGTEIDTAGFNLYRARSANGAYTRLNAELIAAQGSQGGGASYTFTDHPGQGTWFYKLEDVDTHNVRTPHGPIQVNVSGTEAAPRLLFLPIIGK